jgi:predicted Zn-dependent protease
MNRRLLLTIAGAAVLCGLVAACATVPITGRRQLSLSPESQMNAMSFSQYDQVLKESKLSKDAAATAQVKRVGAKIQGAVERYFQQQGQSHQLEGYAWEFNLIESEQQNAWCMPGGKVAFYTGILPVCKDDAGIAVVMGHEVAHAIARHGGERMSQGSLLQMLGAGLAVAFSEASPAKQQAVLGAFGLGAQYGVLMPFGRSQESEADHIGMLLMAQAGYDPIAALQLWERFAARGGAAPPEFLSTHPSYGTRQKNIRGWLAEARRQYRPNAEARLYVLPAVR